MTQSQSPCCQQVVPWCLLCTGAVQNPGGTTEAKNSELWLFSCGHLETEGCARQGDYQGSSDSASKPQHGKARSWPYKCLCLYKRPLQPAVSWKPTMSPCLRSPLLQTRYCTAPETASHHGASTREHCPEMPAPLPRKSCRS